MAPPPAADDAPASPSLKSALLIIGGLLLFAISAIVLFRYLLSRWASSSRPRRASSEAEGGAARRSAAAGREQAEAGNATRTGAAGRGPVEAEAGAARRIVAAAREAEAHSARERVEVEVEWREAGADDDMERLIASLPLFTMASPLAALPKNSPDCAVCLSPFEPDAGLRLLPACRHAFHAACIDAWLRTNPVCPICRSAVSFPLPALPAAAAAGQEPLGSRTSSRSFRVELGSVSNRRSFAAAGGDDHRRTYSLGGSFNYRVDEEFEAIVSRIVRPAAAARLARPANPAAPAAHGEALAEAVGSRGWLGEYLDRVAASASTLSGRWSGRLSQGRRSHSRRHDDSWRWDPKAAAAAAKSATPAAVTTPGEALAEAAAGSSGRLGEHRDRDNLASSASSLSGRWSWRWSQGHHGHRRDESWRWDPEAACRPPREEEREPALVALGRWIFGF